MDFIEHICRASTLRAIRRKAVSRITLLWIVLVLKAGSQYDARLALRTLHCVRHILNHFA